MRSWRRLTTGDEAVKEHRIQAARDFDTTRASFPTSIVAGIFASRFAEKQYFTAKAGSDVAPKVKF